MFSSRKGKKLYKTPSVKYNVCTNKKLTQVCLQNVKFLFFFLFKLFTKSSWKSERQLPLQGLKSMKTTTEQLNNQREKEKEVTSNVWHLVLSTGFSQSSSWNRKQNILANTDSEHTGGPRALCPQRRLCAVRLWGAGSLTQAGGPGLFPSSPPAPRRHSSGRPSAGAPRPPPTAPRPSSLLAHPFSSVGLGGRAHHLPLCDLLSPPQLRS